MIVGAKVGCFETPGSIFCSSCVLIHFVFSSALLSLECHCFDQLVPIPRGAHVKILTGMLVLFFGFEIWPNPIFLGWQIF